MCVFSLAATPYPLSLRPLQLLNILPVFMDLPISAILYKRNHTLYGLLWLASFT